MLNSRKNGVVRLATLAAIPIILLLVITHSLPQLGTSPLGSETGKPDNLNDSMVNQIASAHITEQVAVQNVTSFEAAGVVNFQDAAYRTFTESDYSLQAINAALASCPSGQTVKLASGTYVLNGNINVPAGKTFSGSTDATGKVATIISTSLTGEALRTNGNIDIGSGGNTIENIKTLNGYYFSGINSHDFLFQDCEYNGPTDAAAGQFNLCGFMIYMGANGNYDNGKFVRCVAKNAPGFGFLVAADGSKNSNHLGPNAYSAHNWMWENCEAYDCGIANMDFPSQFVYGCGFDFFEGFGTADDVFGMRITNCVANGNAADGFHIEYMMDINDLIFDTCTADNNGQWFKTGHSTNPGDGVLIGTGFYLGGQITSQTKVKNSQAEDNWGDSIQGGGHGIVDSQKQTDKTGAYSQGQGVEKTVTADKSNGKEDGKNATVVQNPPKQSATKVTSKH